MKRLVKIFLRGVLVFLAAAAAAWQTGGAGAADDGSVAAVNISADQPCLLAQKTQPAPEKAKTAPAPAPEMDQGKPQEAPALPEERKYRPMRRGEQLDRAGTKKLGGEVIRNKED